MRQLAASQDAAALGPAASAVASVACVAVGALMSATSKVRYPPGTPREAFEEDLHETLVRMAVSQCYAEFNY